MYMSMRPGMIRFEVRKHEFNNLDSDYGVYAVVPGAGSDAAILAVFDSEQAATALAGFYNQLARFLAPPGIV
jgi:hypothetical protein